MAGIAGSPYFDSYLYSQKVHCPNLSVHHDFLHNHSWDWMLEEIRYCLFVICQKLQVEVGQLPIEPVSRDWHSDSLTL